MIQRVFWKEWRERRILWLAVIAAAVAPVIFGSGMAFSGDIQAFSPWFMLPAAVAVISGIAMFAKDGDQDGGDFLFSRPVRWQAIVAAKLLTGIAVVIVACALAALAYRVLAPSQYQPFIDQEHLSSGAGFLWWVTLIAFGAGFGSSALAPGKHASGMVFVAFWALTVFTVFLNTAFREEIGWPRQDSADSISAACWFVGGAVAAVFVTRFGLTAGFGYRLKVYALCIGSAFLALAAIEGAYHTMAANNPPPRRLAGLDPDGTLSRDTFLSVSPDGRYGVMSAGPSLVRIEGDRLIAVKRLAKSMDIHPLRFGVTWTADGRAYWPQNQSLIIANPRSGNLVRVGMPAEASWLVPSPDGRYLVYAAGASSDDQRLYFVDLQTARQLKGMVQSKSSAWWVDRDTVGYTDSAGKQARVRLSELNALPAAAPSR
ncbi:MAG: hypothetical protein IT209_10115 [Armatimonadetes bacterium]|nr:hypothetical protein [Armatimonadota bacterium]